MSVLVLAVHDRKQSLTCIGTESYTYTPTSGYAWDFNKPVPENKKDDANEADENQSKAPDDTVSSTKKAPSKAHIVKVNRTPTTEKANFAKVNRLLGHLVSKFPLEPSSLPPPPAQATTKRKSAGAGQDAKRTRVQ